MKAVTAKTNELDLTTGVYSWMRLGQIYDLQGQRQLALAAYQQAVQIAPGSEAAAEARRYMSSRYRR